MSLGGGRKSATPVQQTDTWTPTPEQSELMRLAMPFARMYASSPLEMYTGPTRAGVTENELAARQGYLTAVPGLNQLGQTAADSQKFMLSTDQLDPTKNLYIGAIADQITGKITTNLNENILPGIRGGAIVAGGPYSGGSSRAQMSERLAATDAVGAMGDSLEKLYFDAYNTGLGNIARAQQLNPSIMGQQLFGSDVFGAVGGQERLEVQGGLDDAFNRWNIGQQLPYMRASEILGLVNGFPGGTNTTSVVGATPPRTSPWMGMAGGALSGAAMFPGMPWLGAIGGGLLGYMGSR